jgi:hypothetical protein
MPNAFLAQQRSSGYVFKAGELMHVAQRLVGDSTAWQIVVASAERRTSTNEFLLSATAQKNLRTFSTLREKVNRERSTLSRLVKRGAPILAEEEFLKTSTALHAHDQAVANGEIAKALQEGESFLFLLQTLSKLVEARRTEAVEAKLRTKTGQVDKRKGLLGSWQQAQIGDLFAESDGVRTGTNSTASLAFIDGSQIVISQNTTAVVRTSRIDKLERTAQANITLIKGSLLSQLSQQAQESGSFKLSAGKAEAIIRSSKFWASVNEVSATRIANYEGTMEVKAGKMAVTLKKNQGTVVLKGKEPMPPVELLPAPRLQWNALDTVIFRSELLLRWNPRCKYNQVSNRSQFRAQFQPKCANLLHVSNFIFAEKICLMKRDLFGFKRLTNLVCAVLIAQLIAFSAVPIPNRPSFLFKISLFKKATRSRATSRSRNLTFKAKLNQTPHCSKMARRLKLRQTAPSNFQSR